MSYSIDTTCKKQLASLTLNSSDSICIIGRFKAYIDGVIHPNLTNYVDCFRDKNEKVTLVFEDDNCQPTNKIDFVTTVTNLLDGLKYLHNDLNIVHGLITPDAIKWKQCIEKASQQNETQAYISKLSLWPINHISNSGACMNSHIILTKNISYIPPEIVKSYTTPKSPSGDVWSLCLSLLKLIKPTCKVPENPAILALCDNAKSILNLIEGELTDEIIDCSDKWNEFFLSGLDPNPETRATISRLYSILDLKLEIDNTEEKTSSQETILDYNQEKALDINELYHLWRLSTGRKYELEQNQDDCPPIFRIPCFIASEDTSSKEKVDKKLKQRVIIDTTTKTIPLEQFKADLQKINPKAFLPFVLTKEEILDKYNKTILPYREKRLPYSMSMNGNLGLLRNRERINKKMSMNTVTFADLDFLCLESTNNKDTDDEDSDGLDTMSSGISKNLPAIIKESDFAYQCERMVLFKRLLSCGDDAKDAITTEALIDIPPFHRAQVWAVLLGISQDESIKLYETTSKTVSRATERQISVDIPRCHQYNELMASQQGHEKLARILKAWINLHKSEYVYWQGLDSLAAPFLLINFNNEAIAFSCFNAFINKYLHGFFKQDNQIVVQEYLSMFSALLSYHDPDLADHLDGLGFHPNLYAIPWFLTMFTHVLPLHKILHIWDRLLLGDEKFPICIGLAILTQLRQDLLEYSFNDCIVAFSDLPEVDIERCISDASYFYNATPSEFC